MSVYIKSWIIQLTAFAPLISSFFHRNGWLTLAGFALVLVAMFWPRCPQCRLPAFWRRQRGAPDHFIYYLGNYPGVPSQECSRCGVSLTH